MSNIKNIFKFMFAALASTWIYKLIAKLVKNPLMLVLVLAVVVS